MVDYKEASRKEYDQEANQYALRDKERWKKPGKTALELKKVIEEVRPKKVLELGTGTGRYFPYLQGKSYTGIDISEKMLLHAKQREDILKEKGFEEIAIMQDDIIAFLDKNNALESFDFIFSIGCIGYHIPVTSSLIESITKNLSPNGYLFLQTTQQSNKYKIRKLISHWKNILLGKQDNSSFFTSTSKSQLEKICIKSGLKSIWYKADEKLWFGSPLLVSLHQK